MGWDPKSHFGHSILLFYASVLAMPRFAAIVAESIGETNVFARVEATKHWLRTWFYKVMQLQVAALFWLETMSNKTKGRYVVGGGGHHMYVYIYLYDRETFRVYLPPWVLFTIYI